MLPEMKIPEPDFTRLEAWLTEQNQEIKLRPHELIDNGYAVSLLPYRSDEDVLKLGKEDSKSLPFIDLKAAGIETDRRPQTIIAEVEKLLVGRVFHIGYGFYPLKVFLILPKPAEILSYLMVKWQMQCIGPFGSLPDIDSDMKVFDEIPKLSFEVSLVGEPIVGLDVSRPVTGAFNPVGRFCCLMKGLPVGGPWHNALQSALVFSQWKDALDNTCRENQPYVEKNSKKWWWRFSLKRRRVEREIWRLYQGLLEADRELEPKLAALDGLPAKAA